MERMGSMSWRESWDIPMNNPYYAVTSRGSGSHEPGPLCSLSEQRPLAFRGPCAPGPGGIGWLLTL